MRGIGRYAAFAFTKEGAAVAVIGEFLCIQALTKQLSRQGGGGIVNVISVEANISWATDSAYTTASGALNTCTRKAGRAGAPEEMGNFAAWPRGKEAGFTVGQCIEIDGGQAA